MDAKVPFCWVPLSPTPEGPFLDLAGTMLGIGILSEPCSGWF